MNTITKVLEELKKDKPDISYIRGMLEVLAESGFPPAFELHKPIIIPTDANTSTTLRGPVARTETIADEEHEIPASVKTGPLGKLS